MKSRELIDQFCEQGYAVATDWLSAPERSALAGDFENLRNQRKFKAAGIGKDSQQNAVIRRDEICWFEPESLLPGQAMLWAKFERLRDQLNSELYIGLWDLEGHFAAYEPGAFYRRHLDRFAEDDARVVTVVLYLNEDWSPADGGELVLYAGDERGEKTVKVAPKAGTLAIFMSDRIEHEVLEASAPRRSFAGWYRRRSQSTLRGS